MNNTIKYSVIIPVYNAEKTLKRCLNSIFSQNRSDIEVIVINDGSVDQSQELIEKYSRIYSNLVSITQSNAGVSRARNAGLEVAIGIYILFVDSDDYVSENYFEMLDQLGNSDLYVFARKNIGSLESDGKYFELFSESMSFSKKLEMLISSRKIFPPWNKRFKNEIIKKHQIRFIDKFEIGEDFDFCMNYVLFCESIETNQKIFYNLDVSDNNSLSRKYRPELSQKLTDVYLHIEQSINSVETLKIDKKKIFATIDFIYVKNAFSCIAEEFKLAKPNYLKNRKKYKIICNCFNQIIGREENFINLFHRIFRLLIKMNFIFPIYLVTYLAKRKIYE